VIHSIGLTPDALNSLPVLDLPVALVHPSRFKLRQELGELAELKESISSVGLLHPIIVRREGDSGYEVVSGHRRLASCSELGMDTIRAIVADMDDKTAFEIQLTENVQRESFAPLDEARAFYTYLGLSKKNGLNYGSISELARRIGKSQEYISNRIRLLRLPAKLLEKMLASDGFTVSHAEEIAVLATNPELVETLSNMIVTKKLSVRELESAIPLIKSGTDVELAVELARDESRLKIRREKKTDADDSVEILLRRTRRLLESSLSYIDRASSEIEADRDLYELWIDEVRMKIHDAVDGVIFCEKVRRGRAPMKDCRLTDELFIWSG
jgi:ParB family chromosome partitioning protein